jgi:hypothetical protein
MALTGGALVQTRSRARVSALDAAPADTKFMLAMHNAFRRDLERLERAAHAAEPAPEGWTVLREELEFHHRAEDNDLWPALRARLDRPKDIRIVDEMSAEHGCIGPALDAVSQGFARRGDLGAAVGKLTRLVRDHLDHEEREALPLVRRRLSDADWHQFLRTERRKRGRKGGAQFLCWVLDDATAADKAAVLGELPPPGRFVYRHLMKPRWDARDRWARLTRDRDTFRQVEGTPHREDDGH